MKTITLNGKDYELVIDGDNIIAQGLTEDLIFNDGYAELSAMASDTFDSHYGARYASVSNYNRSEFISEFVEAGILYYCRETLPTAETLTHNLN